MGSESRLVRLDHDWARIVEAAQSAAHDDESWAGAVSDAIGGLLHTTTECVLAVVEHDENVTNARYRALRMPRGTTWDREMASSAGLNVLGVDGFRAFYYPARSVATHLEIERAMNPKLKKELIPISRAMRDAQRMRDVVGAFAYPEPGVILSLFSMHAEPIRLSTYERTLLTRVMLHLEASYRLHRRPEKVIAVLDLDGAVLERSEDAPPNAVMAAHARKRSSGEAELWPALVSGHASLVARGSGRGRRYFIVENPPPSQPFRALTPTEVEIVSQAARGHSTKMIAFALGLQPSAVSTRLTEAASKLGAATRMELVRLAAMLVRDPRARFVDDVALTAAERDVLILLQQGLSNEEIATLRARSVRTIANQVASLLRKTKAESRRALLAKTRVRAIS